MNNIFKKRLFAFTFICLGTLLFASCSRHSKSDITKTQDTRSVDMNENTKLLENCWKHSREENTEQDVQIYRPCDYMEFPLSRFREEFQLEAKQECQYNILARNDAHHLGAGSWNYDEKTKILTVKDKTGAKAFEFEVLEINKDLLKLNRKHF